MTTQHKTALLTCGGFALLVAGGCSRLPAVATLQIEQAQIAMEARDYGRCEQLLDPVIAEHGMLAASADAYYLRGQCRLLADEAVPAREDFEAARRLADDDELRGWISVQLGNLAYEEGRYSRARDFYASAIDVLPEVHPYDEVLYRYGVSLQRSGRFVDARPVLARVYGKFPASRYAVAARRKETWDRDFFAVQCGAFERIELASDMAARLRESGMDALYYPDVRQGGRRYVVRIGRYATYSQAVRELERIRRVQRDAFIVP